MVDENNFRLVMISAMYENGGNVTHRFLDGHPELHVYPFESQLGNSLCSDFLSSLYPFKYRYPDFPIGRSADEYYEMFFDEEYKTLSRARHVSKFRDADFQADEGLRKRIFCEILQERPKLSRALIIAAFFEATFRSWTNCSRSGREVAFVGYSPVIGFDAEKLLQDFPKGHVVHVVRNPWSGFADTSKRPFPLSVDRYAWTWTMLQHQVLVLSKQYSDRFHILRFEDLIASPRKEMGILAEKIGIAWDDALLYPSWNGKRMVTVKPWGTIQTPTTNVNIATMNELDQKQKARIREIADLMLPHFGYDQMAV